MPHVARVAARHDPTTPAFFVSDTRAAAQALGLELHLLEIRAPDDVAGAFEAASGASLDGLFYLGGPLLANSRGWIAELGLKHRLPGIIADPGYTAAGCLMAYGPNIPDNFRRAAHYVHKILVGTRPADLPV